MKNPKITDSKNGSFFKDKFFPSVSEFFRKKIVALKRSPQRITMLLIIIACCIYTFSLVLYSSAADTLYTKIKYDQTIAAYPDFKIPILYHNPAIYVFLNVLFSIMLPISFLSVYKKGKRSDFMFSISIAMVLLMGAFNILYIQSVHFYSLDPWTIHTEVHAQSVVRSIVHLVSLCIVLFSIVARPLYVKLLNKIDTSVVDEYDALIEQKTDEERLLDFGENE